MATYTDNYNLIKPSYSEIADVATINTNMNTIDDIMHSTQISLAPAYDSTQTYNTGDVVMYELLMYKCTDDNVTGTWNASKWERTTASECGDSGSDVEANPSGTATEELNKLRVDNTIYSIPEGSEAVIYGEASGSIAEFDDGSNKPMSKCIAEIKAVQSGSGDPSPTNIRPISGFNGGNVNVVGKNLAKLSNDNLGSNQKASAVYTSSGVEVTATGTYGRMGWLMPVEVGKTYTVSYDAVSSSSTDMRNRVFIGSNDNVWVTDAVGLINYADITTTLRSYNLTFTATTDVLFFGAYVSATATTGTITVSNLQVEEGSTATSYVPYNGTTYSVSWQSQAGTVYGGNIDLVSGVLTVTHANIASYDGETLPSTWISDRDVYSVGGTPTTGAQVVYELATSLTYQLTPIQVNSLLGINNVWNDTNGETEVKYIRDLNTTINILWNAVFNQSNTRSLSLLKNVKSEDTDTKEVEEIEVEETEKEVQKEIKKEEIND